MQVGDGRQIFEIICSIFEAAHGVEYTRLIVVAIGAGVVLVIVATAVIVASTNIDPVASAVDAVVFVKLLIFFCIVFFLH